MGCLSSKDILEKDKEDYGFEQTYRHKVGYGSFEQTYRHKVGYCSFEQTYRHLVVYCSFEPDTR